MLHIGYFSFDEIDEKKKVRHGYFSCIVDAPDPDAAAAKFASHILRLQRDEAAFSSFAKVYIEDLIQVSEVPDEPIVTRLQSSEGEFPLSTSYSLPFTVKNGLSAFGLFSSVEQQESEEDESKIFRSKPFITFRQPAAP